MGVWEADRQQCFKHKIISEIVFFHWVKHIGPVPKPNTVQALSEARSVHVLVEWLVCAAKLPASYTYS